MTVTATEQQLHLSMERERRRTEKLKEKLHYAGGNIPIKYTLHFCLLLSLTIVGVSVSHNFEGHIHETHGHKSTSSEHGEKRKGEEQNEVKAEKRGAIFYVVLAM